MLAPINYMLENKSPMDSFFGGMQSVQGIQQNNNTLKQQELVNDQQAAAQARKAQMEAELDQLDTTSIEAMRAFNAKYPDMAKGVQQAYDALDAKQKQNTLLNHSRIASLVKNGRPESAVDMLNSQVEAYRNSGDEQGAQETQSMADIIKMSPEAGLAALTWGLSIMSPKDVTDNYKNLSGANIAEDAAPYTNANTQATTGKLTSDRVNTVNQDISNAAIGKDPAAFSTVITRQYENGLINKEDYDYMMTNIKDPEKAGSYLRGLAMGNPAIAAAYKPTTAYVNQGDKITAVEVDPYDGTSRTTGTYGVSASPNTVYATDASERNNVRLVNQSNINSERTARTAAERNAIAKHVADTKAQVAAGKLTQQVLPDGRVVVFNTKGQMRPVIDPETGQPLISKKADPAIAKTYREEKVRQDKLAVLLPEIRALIPESTGSVIGLGYDYLARGTVGHTSKGAAATAKLKALGGQLVMMMPRMEGPQSDKDVALYKEMAGNVASPITPKAQRLAAIDAIEQLNKKYADLNNASQVKEDDLF